MDNDKYWLSFADKVAEKSKCQKRKVGCVIVGKDGRVVVTAYNGHPSKTTQDHICLRKNVKSGTNTEIGSCCHSEINSLIFADFNRLEGSTMYLTHPPCKGCSPYLLQAKLANLVYYNDEIERDNGIDLLKELSNGSKYPINIRSYNRET